MLECEGLGPPTARCCHFIHCLPFLLHVLCNLFLYHNHLSPHLFILRAQFLVKITKRVRKKSLNTKTHKKKGKEENQSEQT
jgi:hypothetical protein